MSALTKALEEQRAEERSEAILIVGFGVLGAVLAVFFFFALSITQLLPFN